MPKQESLKKAERLTKLTHCLYRHPRGLTTHEMARACAAVPLWQDGNRYGVQEGYYLPPLYLTLPEAGALYLAARLLTRYADQRQSAVVAALSKLADILRAAFDGPRLGRDVRARAGGGAGANR
jgi:predicted DNA-binding transcriptional regulator YafY